MHQSLRGAHRCDRVIHYPGTGVKQTQSLHKACNAIPLTICYPLAARYFAARYFFIAVADGLVADRLVADRLVADGLVADGLVADRLVADRQCGSNFVNVSRTSQSGTLPSKSAKTSARFVLPNASSTWARALSSLWCRGQSFEPCSVNPSGQV